MAEWCVQSAVVFEVGHTLPIYNMYIRVQSTRLMDESQHRHHYYLAFSRP
jgi:hypothetical protein